MVSRCLRPRETRCMLNVYSMTRLTQHTLESFMTMMPCDIVYSNELNDTVRRCLSRTYRERPTAIEVALLAMKHAR